MPKLTLRPPAPSAAPYPISPNLFRRPGATLQDVADKLIEVLETRDYYEYGFYCVPGGFALATRIERIGEDRRSWAGDARWEAGKAPLLKLEDGFSLKRIVGALFRADPGRYRMIVFYVTNKAITPRAEGPGADYAGLPRRGETELDEGFSTIPFGPNHRVRAFVYEFRRPSVSAPAEFVKQSLPTYTHLDRAGLLAGLRR
jgi:hypothetical protein